MTAAEDRLAMRLAFKDGWLDDEDHWHEKARSLRQDYLDLARETLAVLGGPTEAQQEAARLAAEVRELRRERDRYRDAWLSACRRARRLRVSLGAPEKGRRRPSDGRTARERPSRTTGA